jgi:hypothetical protein
MELFDTLELRMSLSRVASMSPARGFATAAVSPAVVERPNKRQRVTRATWSQEAEWVNFRMSDSHNHVGTTMAKIHEVDPSFEVPKDPRRHCKFCSRTVRNEGGSVMHHSYFNGENAKKTTNFCSKCKEALCDTPPTSTGPYSHASCQKHWHTHGKLPFDD